MYKLKKKVITEAINDAIRKLTPGATPATVQQYFDETSRVEVLIIGLHSNHTSNWQLDNIIRRICRPSYGYIGINATKGNKLEVWIEMVNIKSVFLEKNKNQKQEQEGHN